VARESTRLFFAAASAARPTLIASARARHRTLSLPIERIVFPLPVDQESKPAAAIV
jgi:hypothetical protein